MFWASKFSNCPSSIVFSRIDSVKCRRDSVANISCPSSIVFSRFDSVKSRRDSVANIPCSLTEAPSQHPLPIHSHPRARPASRGGKGPSGGGAVLYGPKGDRVWSGSYQSKKEATSSQAEYKAMNFGMREAARQGVRDVVVKGDNLSVIRQMQGEARVRSENVKGLHGQAQHTSSMFERVNYSHVYRKDNREAHGLARQANNK